MNSETQLRKRNLHNAQGGKNHMIYIAVIIAIVGMEYLIKGYIDKNKELEHNEYKLKRKLILTKYYNRGVALNVFEKQVGMVKMVTGTMIGVLAVLLSYCLLRNKENAMFRFGISMILGGAISNFSDRLQKGYVVDYFSFNFGKKLKHIIFNLADIFIFLGSFFVLIAELLPKNK